MIYYLPEHIPAIEAMEGMNQKTEMPDAVKKDGQNNTLLNIKNKIMEHQNFNQVAGKMEAANINEKLNTTIIIITHEMSAVKAVCNKVAVINNGSFVEMGDTKEVFANPQSSVTKMLLGEDLRI